MCVCRCHYLQISSACCLTSQSSSWLSVHVFLPFPTWMCGNRCPDTGPYKIALVQYPWVQKQRNGLDQQMRTYKPALILRYKQECPVFPSCLWENLDSVKAMGQLWWLCWSLCVRICVFYIPVDWWLFYNKFFYYYFGQVGGLFHLPPVSGWISEHPWWLVWTLTSFQQFAHGSPSAVTAYMHSFHLTHNLSLPNRVFLLNPLALGRMSLEGNHLFIRADKPPYRNFQGF